MITGRATRQAAGLALIRTAPFDLDAILKRQRAALEHREFEVMGRLEIAAYERQSLCAIRPMHARVDWNGTGPMVGVTQGARPELIVLDPVKSELPDLNVDGVLQPQLWENHAVAMWGGWLVFQPLVQIILHAAKGGRWCSLGVKADPSGLHMALLVDPDKGRAHFVGGQLADAEFPG